MEYIFMDVIQREGSLRLFMEDLLFILCNLEKIVIKNNNNLSVF